MTYKNIFMNILTFSSYCKYKKHIKTYSEPDLEELKARFFFHLNVKTMLKRKKKKVVVSIIIPTHNYRWSTLKIKWQQISLLKYSDKNCGQETNKIRLWCVSSKCIVNTFFYWRIFFCYFAIEIQWKLIRKIIRH